KRPTKPLGDSVRKNLKSSLEYQAMTCWDQTPSLSFIKRTKDGFTVRFTRTCSCLVRDRFDGLGLDLNWTDIHMGLSEGNRRKMTARMCDINALYGSNKFVLRESRSQMVGAMFGR
ncbi:hypothetical protein, partial [Neorhizobium huautlense]|uniref:hypothetical protein n=1 Tax=Neorhizobium huautlense TaxID=67774 RepID=UPI0027D7A37B